MKKLAWVWLGIFAFFSLALAEQRRPATQEEESSMLGRVAGAIEDVGAGEYPPMKQKYIKEALHKFSSINKDIEKREYSPHIRWLAHHWYGKALLDSGNPQKAISMLEIAGTEAKSLTEKEKIRPLRSFDKPVRGSQRNGLSVRAFAPCKIEYESAQQLITGKLESPARIPRPIWN